MLFGLLTSAIAQLWGVKYKGLSPQSVSRWHSNLQVPVFRWAHTYSNLQVPVLRWAHTYSNFQVPELRWLCSPSRLGGLAKLFGLACWRGRAGCLTCLACLAICLDCSIIFQFKNSLSMAYHR